MSDIAGLYAAADADAFAARQHGLAARFRRLDMSVRAVVRRPHCFGLVDAAFAPVFRYLDAFERLAGLHLAHGLRRLSSWRAALAARSSVAEAVAVDYPDRLAAFLLGRGSQLSRLIQDFGAAPAEARFGIAGEERYHRFRP